MCLRPPRYRVGWVTLGGMGTPARRFPAGERPPRLLAGSSVGYPVLTREGTSRDRAGCAGAAGVAIRPYP